jgi:hypothetical protein
MVLVVDAVLIFAIGVLVGIKVRDIFHDVARDVTKEQQQDKKKGG